MHVRSIFLLFCILVPVCRSRDYSVLEALGVTCPGRDSCADYRRDRFYGDRNCECDSACESYGDCCIDAHRKRSSPGMVQGSETTCLKYGGGSHAGIYVVARCKSEWNGSQKIREKCRGPSDWSDPFIAAPVTNVAQSVTYKNLYCAECNDADKQSLKTFHVLLSCDGLDDISREQITKDAFYDSRRESWGVNRLDARGNSIFVECDILFDVPDDVKSSVRFCRADVISTCAQDWTRSAVKAKCEEYMAVVYGEDRAYRNPHCAICNHETVGDITCRAPLSGRNRWRNFGTSRMIKAYVQQCPDGHLYDPFFKRCRKLVCALRGYEVRNGRCVPGVPRIRGRRHAQTTKGGYLLSADDLRPKESRP